MFWKVEGGHFPPPQADIRAILPCRGHRGSGRGRGRVGGVLSPPPSPPLQQTHTSSRDAVAAHVLEAGGGRTLVAVPVYVLKGGRRMGWIWRCRVGLVLLATGVVWQKGLILYTVYLAIIFYIACPPLVYVLPAHIFFSVYARNNTCRALILSNSWNGTTTWTGMELLAKIPTRLSTTFCQVYNVMEKYLLLLGTSSSS